MAEGRSRRHPGWPAILLWLLVLLVGVIDIHHVFAVYWLGSDFGWDMQSVVDLVNHRALSPAFVAPPGLLILSLPLLIINQGRKARPRTSSYSSRSLG